MTAPLNIVKLCVGCDSPEELAQWQTGRWGDGPACHITRMWPKREGELLPDGSIYWVFKGVMLARQKLLGLQERIGDDGIRRCGLILDRDILRTVAVPRRPFQGWRYLPGTEAPPDLPAGRGTESPLPPKLAAALADVGLI
ncbi:MAG: DUF1489 domain-containing protein [Paracoccus sp. (in: a-proteobacteria)]|nr:DUF1489 domain-containing protein [Paracoccus sp. (in: a-proteobacteria)]